MYFDSNDKKIMKQLSILSDEELKEATLEKDGLGNYTKRANLAYEVQRERHGAGDQLGFSYSDKKMKRTIDSNSADRYYYGKIDE